MSQHTVIEVRVFFFDWSADLSATRYKTSPNEETYAEERSDADKTCQKATHVRHL